MPPIFFDDPSLLPPDDGSVPPLIFWHPWDLDRLESLIALIISARVSGDLAYFPSEESQLWGVYAAESRDLQEILQDASRQFQEHIVPLIADLQRAPSEFTDLVNRFLLTPLDDLLARLRSGQTINWIEAFRWDLLAEIRKGIDSIRGEQITPEDARHEEMKAALEELLEEKHPGKANPPESDKGRCELIKDEGVLYWGDVRIETFTGTEFQLLSMLWDHREKARDLDRFLADCTVKFGWALDTRRTNFDRHKSGINKKIRKTGYETPINVENKKVQAWPSPLKKKKKTKADRKKHMGPA